MAAKEDKFADFVPHPRYGRRPKVTGLNPSGKDPNVWPHWHSPKECRIPNTAIAANRLRQNVGLGAVTHYFDVTRRCVDCGRMFIFFAQEQRYWYEILRFYLSANCIRCVECRKEVRGEGYLRKRYEQLLSIDDRTDAQSLELAGCCITLIERSVFGAKSLRIARESLNKIPEESKIRKHATFRDLWSRSNVLLENGGITMR